MNRLFAVFVAVGLATPALAQFDGISINGAYLQLGMAKADVISKLSGNSTIKKMPELVDGLCVQPKNQQKLPWDCASVGFSKDKLVSASQELESSADTNAASVLNRFYTLIAKAENASIPISLHTQKELELSNSQQRERTISFFIGKLWYDLTIVQPVGVSGPSFVSLSESLLDTSGTVTK